MRRFKTQEEIEQERKAKHAFGSTAYPTHKKLLIYGRQSSSEQVRNNTESYEQQTEELLEKALDYGWKREDITIYVENEYDKYGQKTGKIRDASGNLSIDERPALKVITQDIERGDVGVVMVWAVDRLTRDEDVIDAPVFAKLCKDYHVLILTNDDMFDFNSRREDLDRFIDLAKEAKNYRLKHVMGRMLPARERVAMRGEYSGHAVPAGLMLDDARKFYLANPLWSPVIARLFRRFRELDANFAALYREIAGKVLFPDVPEEIATRIGQVPMKHVNGGYSLNSREGLKAMLTNVAYIGHVAYNGRIVKHNAHPAIVNEQDFFFAFNALSKTDLDGHVIDRPEKAVRYEQQSDSERVQGLLEGTRRDGRTVLTSPERCVHITRSTTGHAEASYLARRGHDLARDAFTVYVSYLDALIEERLFWYFRPSLGSIKLHEHIVRHIPTVPYEEVILKDAIKETFKSVDTSEQTQLTTRENAIDEIERAIARLEREYKLTFDIMTDKEVRDNREGKARLVKRLDAIHKKQEREAQEQEDVQEAQDMLHSGTAQERWKKWDIEKKRKFLRLVTHDIIIEEVAENWLKLTILWHAFMVNGVLQTALTQDTCYMLRRKPSLPSWTDEEIAIIHAHYKTMPRLELQERLPRRSWESIKQQGYREKILRTIREYGIKTPSDISLNDITFMASHNLTVERLDKRFWWQKITDCNHTRGS